MLSGLLHNDQPEIDYLDINYDEDSFTYETHCARVCDVFGIKSAKKADHLFQSNRVWTKKWKLELRQRGREQIFCHLGKPAAEKQQGS